MQQSIRAAEGPIQAKVTIPGSKSITYRALILAALGDGVSEISGLCINNSTRVLINALHQLGIVTQLDETTRSCIIAGGNGKFPKKQATIWCANVISIARFLLAACTVSSGVYYFDGDAKLRARPIIQLLNALRRQGAQFIPSDATKMPFTLVGADTLEGGEIILNRSLNSQLISALLMIAPFARSPFTFTFPDSFNEVNIDLTCAMMAEFDVLVHRIHQRQLMVPVPQRYYAKDYLVEPDFSLASYFFGAAAITSGEVTIQPFKHSVSKQRAAKFVSVLEKMGCRIIETHTGLTLRGPHELQGVEVSMRDFSDTFMVLAAIAPFAKSPTRISHLGRLHLKETEQINALKTELTKMGIHTEQGENWIKIFPGTPQSGIVNTHNNHRIAMAFSIIGLKSPGVVIDNGQCVNDIYPDFFSIWSKLAEHTNIKV